MSKVTCPVCKNKMPDKIPGLLDKVYECPYCKAALKISASYKITYFLVLFLGSYIGVTLSDLVKLKNTAIERWIANPLIIGLSIGLVVFLLNLLYPKKLTLAELKEK